ncbi:2-amino-4-hydroxy-6-hydroxymethyldihydropteridine diphosphokinase [bacterium]|nr:2-amino-4-hydroxy-6-hydroxymethyldihydropteridine diphosphokinase [bacterium]
MAEIYLSLGSNIEPKELYLNKAIVELKNKINVKKVSSLYSSESMGYKSKNNFLNLVLKAETSVKPKLLLKFIKGIESKLGRTKSKVYMDRTIDIDIIFFGLEIINSKDLIIPHPRAHLRRFVLEPIMEIDKNLIFPGLNSKIVDLLDDIKIQKIKKIKNFNVENI